MCGRKDIEELAKLASLSEYGSFAELAWEGVSPSLIVGICLTLDARRR